MQLERDMGVRLSPSYIRTLVRARGCRRGKPRPALRIPVRGRRKEFVKLLGAEYTWHP